jgi:hypothetical protein
VFVLCFNEMPDAEAEIHGKGSLLPDGGSCLLTRALMLKSRVTRRIQEPSIFSAKDAGNTWSTLNPGFLGTSTPAITIDPLAHNTIYVSSFASNVAVSIDGGLTWAPVSSGLGFAQVQDLLVLLGASKLFAATFNNGVLVFQ